MKIEPGKTYKFKIEPHHNNEIYYEPNGFIIFLDNNVKTLLNVSIGVGLIFTAKVIKIYYNEYTNALYVEIDENSVKLISIHE